MRGAVHLLNDCVLICGYRSVHNCRSGDKAGPAGTKRDHGSRTPKGILPRMRVVWILCLALFIAGCSNNAPAPKDSTPVEETPPAQSAPAKADPLYEQLHSGLFQADAAVKKLADALDIAQDMQKKATGSFAEAMKDVVATIDDSGHSLAALTGGEPPTAEDVANNRSKYQAQRADLINQISDILKDMRDQDDAADSMADIGNPEIQKPARHLDELLLQIIDDLKGALAALGAQDQSLQNTPDTGDTNQKPPPGFDPNSASGG